MILNDAEFAIALERMKESKKWIATERQRLKSKGYSPAEVKRGIDPAAFFNQQLMFEIESYRKLKRGEFDELVNFQGMGPALIGLRIYLGLTQRELAERLGVHESQVSRDERNDYHGLTVGRATRIFEALGVSLKTTFVFSKPSGRRASKPRAA